MNYSICASQGAANHEPVLFRGRFEDAFAYAKALGFEGVELHIRDTREIDALALMQRSERTGVTLACISTGLAKRVDNLSLTDTNPARRAQALDRVKEHLSFASHFGCGVIIGSMRGNLTHGRDDETCQLFLQSMLQLAEYAENKNCRILLEAINRYENNYLNTAAQASAFLVQIGSSKVQLLLDTFHMNIEEADLEQALLDSREYLGHFHVADNTRHYPGSGHINFSAVISALEQIEYKGWCSLEYLPIPDAKTAAQKGLDYLRQFKRL